MKDWAASNAPLFGIFSRQPLFHRCLWPQTRDKHGHEQRQGGDMVTSNLVPIAPASSGEGRHVGYVVTARDNEDGTYDLSHLPEVAG